MTHTITPLQVSSLPFTTVAPEHSDLIGILRRGWLKLLAGVCGGVVLGLLLIAVWPTYYTATSQIIIERGLNRYLQANKVVDGPSIEDDTWGQLHILSSEDVILPVVRNLNLSSDPEFVKLREEPGQLAQALNFVKSLFRPTDESAASTRNQEGTEQIASRAISESMWSTWESQPSVIRLSFRSRSAAKSAQIANAIAESYVSFTAENRDNSSKLASRFIQERLSELKSQVAEAERQLIEYKIAKNVGPASSSLSSEQLKTMSSHLIDARIGMLDARARMEGIGVNGNNGVNAAVQNDLLVRLKDQYVQTESRAHEMEARVGRDHSATIKLFEQLKEIRAGIEAEQKRIASGYAAEYEFAKARYEQIATAIEGGLSAEANNYEVTSRIRELESSAETLRGLYNNTLQRYSEAIKSEGQHSLPDARVLSRAVVPTQTDSKKQRYAVILAAGSVGMLAAAGLLLLSTWPFGVYRTTDQVKRSLGLPAFVLPMLDVKKDNSRTDAHRHTLDAPFSRYSEVLRIVWTLISAAERTSGAKVFCIVSSVSNEGKTTIAANLAAQIASESGLRVLLIDGDPHHHALTNAITPTATSGLIEALDKSKPLEHFVVRGHAEDLYFLPCPQTLRKSNSAQLLGSKKMEHLISAARNSYDLIFIETPPLAMTSDGRMFARFADAYLFVVEWGKTTQNLTIETLSDFPALWERVLCVLLNKADARALQAIESYKGSSYHSYYSESST